MRIGEFMNTDHLVELVRRHGLRSRESLQMADRLRKLLPEFLQSLKRASGYRGSLAERQALTDSAYLERLDEYLDVYAEGLKARVQSDTHRMLLEAWGTLNAFQRVLEQRKAKT